MRQQSYPGKFKEADRARREVTLIHVGKGQLGLDDATYRAMLRQIGGVESSKDLDAEGRKKVIQHLISRGAEIGKKPVAGKPATEPADAKKDILAKIEWQLGQLGKPWGYAMGTAKRIFPNVARWEWLSVAQLGKVSGALERTMKNKARKAGVE